MNSAEEIYREIEGKEEGDKYKVIESYVAPPGREESVHLDFTEKENPDTASLSDSDKRQYSKALSGFANSDGGVLVWGITCKKKNSMDTASELKPITNIRGFISNLNRLTGDAVSHPVEGIKYEEIKVHGGSETNCGYVAILIPASDAGPHRAEARGTKQYYKRSGDSFYPMEHYDIEDMFGRRKKPKLSLEIHLSDVHKKSKTQSRLRLIVSITNNGRGIAKYPFLSLRLPERYRFLQFSPHEPHSFGLPLLEHWSADVRKPKFCGNAHQVIHPGVTRDVTRIEASMDEYSTDISDLEVEYELGAEDMMMTKDNYVIKASEIKAFLKQKGHYASPPE